MSVQQKNSSTKTGAQKPNLSVSPTTKSKSLKTKESKPKLERKPKEVFPREFMSLETLHRLMGISYEDEIQDVDLDKPNTKYNLELSKQFGVKIFSNHVESSNLAQLIFNEDSYLIEEKLGLTKSKISSFVNNQVFISCGSKSDIILDEKQQEFMSIGDELDVFIYSLKRGELRASLSKAQKEINFNRLFDGQKTHEIFNAKILKSIPHGYIVSVLGEECYMPGSGASLSKLEDVTSIVGNTIEVQVVNYVPERKSLIVDAKKVLQKKMFEEIKTWKTGTEIVGTISGYNPSHGIFVLVNTNVSALIPIQSLTKETKEKVTNKTLKIGDKINSFMKEFDYKQRLVLTQNLDEISSWKLDSFKNQMEKGTVLTGKIVNKLDHGYLVEIKSGVKGVIPFLFTRSYKGNLDNGTILDVAIMDINFEKEKMQLVPYTQN